MHPWNTRVRDFFNMTFHWRHREGATDGVAQAGLCEEEQGRPRVQIQAPPVAFELPSAWQSRSGR